MPAVYLCNVVGDGTTIANAFRPDIPAGAPFACLMLHEATGRAVIVSPNNTLAGAGITKLVQGPTWAALRANAAATSPTAGQRSAVATWLANNGYKPMTTQTTWAEIIHFVARQLNPAADLTTTEVS